MSSNDSTLKATYDKVTGGAQEMAGSLMGSGGDQVRASSFTTLGSLRPPC